MQIAAVVTKLARCIEFQMNKRDEAAEAFAQAYYLVTGNSPKWSDTFGYDEALDDIKDACAILRANLLR